MLADLRPITAFAKHRVGRLEDRLTKGAYKNRKGDSSGNLPQNSSTALFRVQWPTSGLTVLPNEQVIPINPRSECDRDLI
jgi:hypothetical protein